MKMVLKTHIIETYKYVIKNAYEEDTYYLVLG
jgi:hypothetical protein